MANLTCPHCHNQMSVPDHLAGRRVNCLKCQVLLAAPFQEDRSATAIRSLLNQMRGRLGMYIGKPSVTRLASFLYGYDMALRDAGVSDPFLPDFRDWLQQRYGCTTAGWEDLILAEAGSESAAINRFWQLFDGYLAAVPPEPGAREVPAIH